MFDRTIMGHYALGIHLIIPVNRKFAILNERCEEIQQIARIHVAGMLRQQTRQIGGAADEYVTVAEIFAGLRQLAVAAGFRRQVHDDGARFHGFHHDPGDNARRRAAGNGGGGDDGIRLGHMFRQYFLLFYLFLRREFACVTTAAFRRHAGIHELRSQGFHLFARRRAHIVAFHHGAEPARGGDGLQARHARADHQHFRRTDGAGGGGEHREKTAELVGGHQRGLVTGGGGLGRQCIHRLGAGNARHQLHGETGDFTIA